MAEFPALPLWTDAYMADTDHLTDAENGLYMRLLMIMWRSPNCRLPNDNDWLARRFHRSVTEITLLVRPLIDEFCQTDGNWIIQKRLRSEWDWCQQKRKKNTANANSRWQNEKDQSKRISERNAPTPTPTPIESSIDSSGSSRTQNVLGNFDFLSDDGSVLITADEFRDLESELISLKNIRGVVRHACRSWLNEVQPPADRKRVLLRWLRKKQTERAAAPPRQREHDVPFHEKTAFREDKERQENYERVMAVRERHSRERRARVQGHDH